MRCVQEAGDNCVRGGERGGQLGEGDSEVGDGDNSYVKFRRGSVTD